MPAQTKSASKKSAKKKTRAKSTPEWTARHADKHELYQAAVQNVEAEIDFVDKQYTKRRDKKARLLREDFCGTGNTSCEWARRRKTNEAVGLDIDGPTLAWGRAHNLGALPEEAQERVRLLERDVRTPGDAVGVDILLAMNFSYWLFQERREMIAYLKGVRDSLADDGIFFCDFYGGYEAMKECEERRACSIKGKGRYTYVWEQHRYEPISGEMNCRIHFEFPDGTAKRNAFKYTWRLWTLPEYLDVLGEVGFSDVTVYWEGDDGKGGGNGVFRPAKRGTADPAFICYIACEK